MTGEVRSRWEGPYGSLMDIVVRAKIEKDEDGDSLYAARMDRFLHKPGTEIRTSLTSRLARWRGDPQSHCTTQHGVPRRHRLISKF
jgi:hypothetical protein